MSETANVTTPAAQEAPFDYAAWKAGQQTETKAPDGETKQPPAETKAPVDDNTKAAEPETDHDEDEVRLPRSIRRELNKLRRENGELAGRLAMVQELQAAGMSKKEATAAVDAAAPAGEPQREQYASDAEYIKALAKHEAKQLLAEQDAERAQAAQAADFMGGIDKATTKFHADVKDRFPDFAEVLEAASAKDDIDPAKHETFIALIAQSDERAAVLYHLAKNPDERAAILAMTPAAQIKAFHRLEGRLERAAAKEETPAKPTATEVDAKKAKPSGAVAAKGGTTAPASTPMLIPGTNSINPAWKAEQAAKAGWRP